MPIRTPNSRLDDALDRFWRAELREEPVESRSRLALQPAPYGARRAETENDRSRRLTLPWRSCTDTSILARQVESPAGLWLSNYVAKTIIVRKADVQGMRTGISSPFYQDFRSAEPGRGDGSVAVEDGYFRNYIGAVIATVYSASAEAGIPIKKAVIRDSVFGPLNVPLDPLNPPAAISMNYRMSPNDPEPRE